MIIACPACGKQYRIDPARLQATRRLRCSACGLVFDRDAAAAGPPPAPDATPQTARVPAGAPAGGPLVLVADEPREFRDLVQRTLAALGCRVEVTDDGEKAFRATAARRPVLVILNVYLRRLLGVAVCEGIKGSPDLRTTRVALIGTVFKSGRFMRAPGHLYGADDYFEDVIPAAELRRRLERLLSGPARGAAPAGAPGRGAAAGPGGGARDDAAEDAALAALGADTEEPAGGFAAGPEAIDPRAEILRLARIMVSDLKMYYPDEFRKALLERSFSETFREELAQAKDLIARRFPEVPNRMETLAAALKEGLTRERALAGRAVAGP